MALTLRLTNDDRDLIVAKAVKKGFAERTKAVADKEHDLALAAYEHIFPLAERKAAAALPKRWASYDGCLRLVFTFKRIVLSLRAGEEVPVPANGGYCRELGTITDAGLNERFDILMADKDALKADIQKTSASLKGVLYRAKTLRQLEEAWPEGKQFYEHLAPAERAPVPALQMSEINAALGLQAEAA